MNPENIAVLTTAKIDYCSLANNHVLDWGYSGLMETLETLKKADVRNNGAGRTLTEAAMPAIMEIKGMAESLCFPMGPQQVGSLLVGRLRIKNLE